MATKVTITTSKTSNLATVIRGQLNAALAYTRLDDKLAAEHAIVELRRAVDELQDQILLTLEVE